MYILSILESVEIKDGAEQHDHRKENHQTSNHLVDDDDAIRIELSSDLVNEPRQSKPPQQGSSDDTGIAQRHFYWMIGNDESQLCKGSHKKKDYEWVGERDEEGCQSIVPQRAFYAAADVHVARGIVAETIDAKE